MKKARIKEVRKEMEQYSKEKLINFLISYSSELRSHSLHCKDLCDQDGRPFITSVLGSGLNVINNTGYKMSEEIHYKAKQIIGFVQNNPNHNYTKDEIMFTLAYDSLYYHLEERKKIS